MLAALRGAGHEMVALSRHPADGSGCWQHADLCRPQGYALSDTFDAAIHAAPLWLLPANLGQWQRAGVRQLIAFSSTSALTKTDSANRHERQLAADLREAERQCRDYCEDNGISLTIFQPTLIYGFRRDRNVCTIARFIKRFRFFPLAGRAQGKRQPVHAADLVDACLRCLRNPVVSGRIYQLSGGETLRYADMVRRIFAGLGLTPRLLSLPPTWYRAVLRLAQYWPGRLRLTADMADRMAEDLCFDHGPATADFGYAPAGFLDNPARDLPLVS